MRLRHFSVAYGFSGESRRRAQRNQLTQTSVFRAGIVSVICCGDGWTGVAQSQTRGEQSELLGDELAEFLAERAQEFLRRDTFLAKSRAKSGEARIGAVVLPAICLERYVGRFDHKNAGSFLELTLEKIGRLRLETYIVLRALSF